jgi:hypothetical protein
MDLAKGVEVTVCPECNQLWLVPEFGPCPHCGKYREREFLSEEEHVRWWMRWDEGNPLPEGGIPWVRPGKA